MTTEPGAQRFLQHAEALADELAEASSADLTIQAYSRDFRDFAAWCDSLAVPSLPAAPRTVSAYLASLMEAGLKASTIRRRRRGSPGPTVARGSSLQRPQERSSPR
jgi:site-specific recombinase XerD